MAIEIHYTWECYLNDIDKIAFFCKEDSIKTIYGVPRGGLIMAVILSHKLNKKLILDKDKINRYTLVVDDINDTGMTLKKLLRGKRCFRVWTLWKQGDSRFTDSFSINFAKGEWIVFPFETNESSKKDGN